MAYTSTFGTDNEVGKLRAENNALAEELAQCQSDKEFVWSLWKRLQVANPDITQAIGMVIQREKEKTELKDRKVLEILQVKDENIAQLEKTSHDLQSELSRLRTSKVDAEDRARRFERDYEDLRSQLQHANIKIEDLASKSQENAGRQAVRELDQENMDLKQQVSRLERQIEDLSRDKQDLGAVRDAHKDRVKILEEDLKQMGDKYDEQVREANEIKKQSRKAEPQVAAMKREIEAKNKEMETLRKELSDVWENHNQGQEHTAQQANLIRQLRALQTETQAMLKNQEDAFNVETKSMQNTCRAYKKSLHDANIQVTELRQTCQTLTTSLQELQEKVQELNKKIHHQDDIIRDLEHQLQEALGAAGSGRGAYTVDREIQASDQESDVGSQIQDLQAELKHLRSRIDSRPSTRDRSASPFRSPYMSGKSTRSRSLGRERSRSLPPKESRSSSLHRSRSMESRLGGDVRDLDPKVLAHRVEVAEGKHEEARKSLLLMARELEETRGAHQRRVERLRALQASYRLMKEQYKILEEEAYGPKKRKRKVPRPHPKTLQKEDSNTVWNELTYFKKEHKNLVLERMNLEEELDGLRVKSCQDEATIHELRLCLDQERQELEFLTKDADRSSTPVPTCEEQLDVTTQRLEKALKKLITVQKHKQAAEVERNRALEERRAARSEVTVLQKQEAEQRILLADLKRDNVRLQREIKRMKKHASAAANRKSTLAKKYQKSLNNSIRELSDVFGDFDQENVWEEVSETQEDSTCLTEEPMTEDTMDSLGEAIAHRAQESMPGGRGRMEEEEDDGRGKRTVTTHPTQRTVESMTEHVRRMNLKNEPPTRDQEPLRSEYEPPMHRDIALSPIHFSPSSPRSGGIVTHHVSRKSHAPSSRNVTALKQRVMALQRQVTILKISKEHANKAAVENKKTAKNLDNELQITLQKLQASKLTVQRLTSDLDRLRDEREDLEHQLGDCAGSDNTSLHAEQDWLALNSRLKSTASEMTKQAATIKQLKTENALHIDKIQQLNDRVSHQERDLGQKRSLVEDLRIKMRLMQENVSTEQAEKETLESKLRSSQEASQRIKTQLESQKVRLQAVSRDKNNRDENVYRLTEELERKCKQVIDLQRKHGELQTSLSAVERAAEQQLHSLATHSEAAIDMAQAKLTEAGTRIQEHNKFVRMFAHSLVTSLQQQRIILDQRAQRKRDEEAAAASARLHGTGERTGGGGSMHRAQSMACDILNISHSDLHDLMSVSGQSDDSGMSEKSETPVEVKNDRKWTKRCEKALHSKEDFSMKLVQLFMEKVEEKSKMTVELATS